MKELKTAPVTGDNLFATLMDDLDKLKDGKRQFTGIKLWPAAAVEETFRKAAGEIGGANETGALRTFYAEMVRFLRMGTYITFDIGEDEITLAALEWDWLTGMTHDYSHGEPPEGGDAA